MNSHDHPVTVLVAAAVAVAAGYMHSGVAWAVPASVTKADSHRAVAQLAVDPSDLPIKLEEQDLPSARDQAAVTKAVVVRVAPFAMAVAVAVAIAVSEVRESWDMWGEQPVLVVGTSHTDWPTLQKLPKDFRSPEACSYTAMSGLPSAGTWSSWAATPATVR